MKIAMVTDAWEPQVNGVVRTLKSTARELEKLGHTVEFITPLGFRTLPCPTYPDIRLSLLPGGKVAGRLTELDPDAIHIATEGPLGLAARRFALRHGIPFTTAYHTRFPEYVKARVAMPLSWTYAFLRWFHGPAKAVMAPTVVVKNDLEAWGFRNVVLWSRGVDLDIFKPQKSTRLNTDPPIFLYVGRVAVEKNIEAFLALDLPGSKWVAGAGPALSGIRMRYPGVNFLGVLNQLELAQVYASANVFVFPSKTDTFGLVLLEAMACGLPVAAYPVTGPLDVIGDSNAGVMHEDLRTACLAALELKREDAVAHAQKFSWRAATEEFLANLHPRDRTAGLQGRLADSRGAV
ncbi:MAG: glycosyltransferase family 1 protein [Pseudomonadota bacterium]|nr:glycosyltransferase family 1 protein [Pseudomonadota bacterium]